MEPKNPRLLKMLETYRMNDLITDIEDKQLSLLETFSASTLRSETKNATFAIRSIFRLIFLGYNPSEPYMKRRRIACDVLGRFCPDEFEGDVSEISAGLVVGYNHPSLHELLSLIAWTLSVFPGKESCFVLDLPLFESLAPIAPKLKRIGIHLTPCLSRETVDGISEACDYDPEIMSAATTIKHRFRERQKEITGEFTDRGDIIFVATSVIRQVTVFRSKASYTRLSDTELSPLTMSNALLDVIGKNRENGTVFLPIAVVPSQRHDAGLNLLRPYRLTAGTIIPVKTAIKRMTSTYAFEHFFLTRLAECAPAYLWYPAAI